MPVMVFRREGKEGDENCRKEGRGDMAGGKR